MDRDSMVVPHGKRLLCTRYVQEEKATQKIVLNPAWRRDNNRQMWRLKSWGPKGEEYLREAGIVPEEGLLLVTPPNQGVNADLEGTGDDNLFWVWADTVLCVIEGR